MFVVVAAVLWGTTGTAATFAPDVGPLAIGAAAMGLGGLLQAVTAVRPLVRCWARLRAQPVTVIVGALSVAVYPLAFYSSMDRAGVAVGTVVSIGSAPLASAVVERVVDRRGLSGRWASGAVLGLAGVALLCFGQALSEGSTDGVGAVDSALGIALGVVAGLTYAVYSWAAHRLMRQGVESRAAMGVTFGGGGSLLMPVLLLVGDSLVTSWSNAAVGVYLAVVPMFAGYVLFGWGLSLVPASTATTLSLIEPFVAAVLAVLIVGERLPGSGWVGAALVISSLLVLTLPSRVLGRRGRTARRDARLRAETTLPEQVPR